MPTHMIRRQMIALTGAALWSGAARAEAPALLAGANPVETIEGRAFASHWRITAPAGTGITHYRAGIERLLARVDREMSPWRDDSDLFRFNAATQECAVSHDVALVARAALDLAQNSGGAFDPTVGPLVARWGFGRISGLESGRWQGLAVGDDSLRKDQPGLTMDLCGIAKGRALDLMAEHLLTAGAADFLIDLGGELKSMGLHPAGRDWRVAVEDPRAARDGAAAVLALPSGLAVATSGLRAQSYDLGAHRYGHIIDPQSARPAEGRVASVSVLSGTAMLADGWATALLAAGEAGPKIARANSIAALFLLTDKAGLSVITTGGFDRHLM